MKISNKTQALIASLCLGKFIKFDRNCLKHYSMTKVSKQNSVVIKAHSPYINKRTSRQRKFLQQTKIALNSNPARVEK
jgi:hypothetical protein